MASPGSLIVTFAGLYLRRIGGWIAVADLISLLATTGQRPAATRQALVRLKSRSFVESETRGGRAGYVLTEGGLADLAVGDARIFRYGEASITDGWVLAVFSVPEESRAARHQLRQQLAWQGFGSVGAGVCIAPVALAERARADIQAQGLGGYVTWFTGRPVESADVGRWWDIDLLQNLYRGFVRRWESIASVVPSRTQSRQAFVGYLQLVDDWRQFPRVDPGLPSELLPTNWPGRRAFEIFSGLTERWAGDAEQFVVDQALRRACG